LTTVTTTVTGMLSWKPSVDDQLRHVLAGAIEAEPGRRRRRVAETTPALPAGTDKSDQRYVSACPSASDDDVPSTVATSPPSRDG
jgi:hypothetical protein